MAAKVLPPGSGGSFLDSPSFNHARTKPPAMGVARQEASSPVTTLCFDTSDMEGEITTPYILTSQLNTPDSGFSAPASSTPIKTPESEFSSVVTPPSTGNGQRKRKTVTIDESQISVVVISPDDLFNVYSGSQGQSDVRSQHPDVGTTDDPDLAGQVYDLVSGEDEPLVGYQMDAVTGWPIKRSDSLESRDNPFLPGGDLSREAEDLLSRATIVRDHFYLDENEKRILRQQQQQQQQRQRQSGRHVQIKEEPEHYVHHSNNQQPDNSNNQQPENSSNHQHQNMNTARHPPSTPPLLEIAEERIPVTSDIAVTAAAPLSSSPDDSNPLLPKENGNFRDSHVPEDGYRLDIPDEETQLSGQGQTGTKGGASQNLEPGDLQVQDSDKKGRNKCCSVM